MGWCGEISSPPSVGLHACLEILSLISPSLSPLPLSSNARLTLDDLGDRLELDIARSLVDRPDLAVAVELLDPCHVSATDAVSSEFLATAVY